jgi:hypothetical protein
MQAHSQILQNLLSHRGMGKFNFNSYYSILLLFQTTLMDIPSHKKLIKQHSGKYQNWKSVESLIWRGSEPKSVL